MNQRKRNRWARNRSAVSPVIAELLLIVITVAIGTLVYTFASTAFGGFGTGFSNLVQNAGAQLQEGLVVEQTYFFSGINGSFGGALFIRNVGSAPTTIEVLYMTNDTTAVGTGLSTVAPCAVANPEVPAGDVCYAIYSGGPPETLQTASPFPLQIPADGVIMVRFATNTPVHGGTVYSFTLVTQRGNQFVVNEKA